MDVDVQKFGRKSAYFFMQIRTKNGQKRTKKRILSTSINQLTAKIALGYVTKPIGHSKQIMHAYQLINKKCYKKEDFLSKYKHLKKLMRIA